MQETLPGRIGAEHAHDADGLRRPRLGLDAVEQLDELLARERFLLEESSGDAVECDAVLREKTLRLGVRSVRDASLLGVAQALRLLGEGVVVRAHRARR